MTRWVWLVLVGIVVGVAPVLAEPDLKIEGKPLAEWLQLLREKNKAPAARDVVRRMPTQTQRAVNELVDSLLAEDDPRVALGELTSLGAAAVPALTRTLFAKDPKTKALALIALGQIGRPARSASPVVIGLLGDSELGLRELAVRILPSIDPGQVSLLRPLSRDGDHRIQLATVSALLECGAPAQEVMPRLVGWLAGDAEQRSRALLILANLGPEATPAVAELVRLLQSEDVDERQAALVCLGRIGPAAKEAVPALKALLTDPERAKERIPVAASLWRIARAPEAIATWKSLAQDVKNPQRAQAARRWWLTTRDADAIKMLVETVQTKDLAQRALALEALREAGPAAAPLAVEPLRKVLEGPDVPLIDQVLVTLASFGEAAKPVAEAVARRTREERKPGDSFSQFQARLTLVEVQRDAASIKTFAELLKDDEVKVRAIVARTLPEFGPLAKEVLPEIRETLRDRDGDVQAAVAVALWRLAREPKALETLTALLRHPRAEVRSGTALELGYYFEAEAKSAVPEMIRCLWDDATEVRNSAAENLGRIGPAAKDAVPTLIAILRDDRDELHTAAAEGLGLIGPDAREAVPILKQRLAARDSYVRACAALALWHIEKDASTEKLLVPLLEDRNFRTRVTAAEALWRQSEHPRAVPVVLEVLRETDFAEPWLGTNQAFMAIRVLGRIGPKAAPALADIRMRLTSEDPELRRTATKAIQQIEGK